MLRSCLMNMITFFLLFAGSNLKSDHKKSGNSVIEMFGCTAVEARSLGSSQKIALRA